MRSTGHVDPGDRSVAGPSLEREALVFAERRPQPLARVAEADPLPHGSAVRHASAVVGHVEHEPVIDSPRAYSNASAARLSAEYELLISQRLVLQPRLELQAFGKADPDNGIGSGLSDLELGLIINFNRRRLKDGGLVRVLNPDKLEAMRGHPDAEDEA